MTEINYYVILIDKTNDIKMIATKKIKDLIVLLDYEKWNEKFNTAI